MKSRNLAIIRADSFSKYRAELMGLATLLVLLVHSFECRISYRPDILNLIFKQSFIGVDIFLLISGVGVYWSLAKNESATDFWMRRIGKILPIYLPIISAFAVWKLAVSGGGYNGLFKLCFNPFRVDRQQRGMVCCSVGSRIFHCTICI